MESSYLVKYAKPLVIGLGIALAVAVVVALVLFMVSAKCKQWFGLTASRSVGAPGYLMNDMITPSSMDSQNSAMSMSELTDVADRTANAKMSQYPAASLNVKPVTNPPVSTSSQQATGPMTDMQKTILKGYLGADATVPNIALDEPFTPTYATYRQ